MKTMVLAYRCVMYVRRSLPSSKAHARCRLQMEKLSVLIKYSRNFKSLNKDIHVLWLKSRLSDTLDVRCLSGRGLYLSPEVVVDVVVDELEPTPAAATAAAMDDEDDDGLLRLPNFMISAGRTVAARLKT